MGKTELADIKQQNQSWISALGKSELIAIPMLGLALGVWLFHYVGTSVEWDDLMYMNFSQCTTPQAWVLNRYGHIYLQKLFMFLVGDALSGAKAYWCFLVMSTLVLIYFCARMITGKRGYLAGIIAISLFCTEQLVFYYAGCTLVDFALMFFVMLGSFIYLVFLTEQNRRREIYLVIFGLIFFWAVKTKEPGICLAIFFLALGEDSSGVKRIRQFCIDMSWVFLGMLCGCLMLMSLDFIFMGDGLFSVRPSSISGLLNFNVREISKDQRAMSLYAYIATKPLFYIFLLYVLAGFGAARDKSPLSKKLLWALPLLLLFFVTYIRGRWHIIARYFLAATPLLCVWAGQFFDFKIFKMAAEQKRLDVKKTVLNIGSVILAFVIACLVMSQVPSFVEKFKMQNPDVVYSVVILVLAVFIVLFTTGLLNKTSRWSLFLSFLSLFLFLCYPLGNNFNNLSERVTAKRSQWRYEPYRIFGDQLSFGEDVKVLVTNDVHVRSWFLGRERQSQCWMFNLYFNQKFNYDQFIHSRNLEDVLKADYTYAFLTWRDWNSVREKFNIEELVDKYEIKSNQSSRLVLLKKIGS